MRKLLFLLSGLVLAVACGCASTSSTDVGGAHQAATRGQRGDAPHATLTFPVSDFGEPSWITGLFGLLRPATEAAVSPPVALTDLAFSGSQGLLGIARPKETRNLVMDFDGLIKDMAVETTTHAASGTTVTGFKASFYEKGWTAVEKPEGGEPEPVPTP